MIFDLKGKWHFQSALASRRIMSMVLHQRITLTSIAPRTLAKIVTMLTKFFSQQFLAEIEYLTIWIFLM